MQWNQCLPKERVVGECTKCLDLYFRKEVVEKNVYWECRLQVQTMPYTMGWVKEDKQRRLNDYMFQSHCARVSRIDGIRNDDARISTGTLRNMVNRRIANPRWIARKVGMNMWLYWKVGRRKQRPEGVDLQENRERTAKKTLVYQAIKVGKARKRGSAWSVWRMLVSWWVWRGLNSFIALDCFFENWDGLDWSCEGPDTNEAVGVEQLLVGRAVCWYWSLSLFLTMREKTGS